MVYAYPDPIERITRNDGEETPVFDGPSAKASSTVQRFYEGTNVLVTGGTGFIGMVLVEKLLRSCPGIKQLFLLIRSKKGKSSDERVKEMFSNPLYTRVLEGNAKILEKVRIVCGNVEQDDLGLSPADAAMLKRDINIVFNVAATVRFDETLRKSYAINVISVKALVNLAESMPNLKAFVHVSTAFLPVHLDSKVILEDFYPSPYSETEIEAMLNSADDYTLFGLTRLILGRVPNTYILTKLMGEEFLRGKVKSLPLAIYRPALVLNTYMEPIHGWSCTFQNVGAILSGVGLGVLRVVSLAPEKRVDGVPVDKCASALAVLPWHACNTRHKKSETAPIYNHVSDRKPITWGRLEQEAMRVHREEKLSSKYQVWTVDVSMERDPLMFELKFFLYHVLPLPFFVLMEKLQGQKPRIWKVYTKIALLIGQSKTFLRQNWMFNDSNLVNVWSCMPDEDRRLFPFDMGDFDWIAYFSYFTKGTMTYLLHDALSIQRSHTLRVKLMILVDDALRLLKKTAMIFIFFRLGVLVHDYCRSYVENKLITQ